MYINPSSYESEPTLTLQQFCERVYASGMNKNTEVLCEMDEILNNEELYYKKYQSDFMHAYLDAAFRYIERVKE